MDKKKKLNRNKQKDYIFWELKIDFMICMCMMHSVMVLKNIFWTRRESMKKKNGNNDCNEMQNHVGESLFASVWRLLALTYHEG